MQKNLHISKIIFIFAWIVRKLTHYITMARRFKFDKPLVESTLAPASIDVYWIERDGNTGVLTKIKEYQSGQWVSILENASGDPQALLDSVSYGVRWTKQGILESPVLERVGNTEMHKHLPIQSLFKGCVADGNEIQYYLDPEDWSKKEDGTASVLDGTDGTVRVHTPKFYLRSWAYYDAETETDVREVRISQVQFDPTWKEIPSCVIDAYCATLDMSGATYKAKSVNVQGSANLTNFLGGQYNDWWDSDNDEVDTSKVYTNADARLTDYGKPLTGVTRAQARTFAENAGSELLSYFIYKALYWCMVIEYATFDLMLPINNTKTAEGYTQGGIGMGLRNGSTEIDEHDEAGESNGSGIFSHTDYTDGYGRYGSRTPNGWADEIGNGTGSKVLFAAGSTVGTGDDALTQDVSVFKWRGFENFCGDQYIWLDGFISGAAYEDDQAYPAALYITEKSESLDDTLANKEIVLPAVYTDGNGCISDFMLGQWADPIGCAEEAEDYHVGMCDDQYLSVSYVASFDDVEHKLYSEVGESGDDAKRVLFCGAFCGYADAYLGPGYFGADDVLSNADGALGFRTLNRNPVLAE